MEPQSIIMLGLEKSIEIIFIVFMNCYCCYLQTSRHASFNIRKPKMDGYLHTHSPHHKHSSQLESRTQNMTTHFLPLKPFYPFLSLPPMPTFTPPSLHPHPIYCLWPKAYIHKLALSSSKTTIPLVQDVVFTPHPKTSIYFNPTTWVIKFELK
jgi:hypothetical protein